MKKVNVAVVGATGVVGSKIVEVLEERDFPVNEFHPMASAKSAGGSIKFKGKDYVVEELNEKSFENSGIDIALFAAGGDVSEKYVPLAVKNGVRVVDNSSFYRMEEGVPLVIPEVNPDAIKDDDMIIANPNCSTIQSVVALKPLYDKYGIKRIVYNTYQAVSGAGMKGLNDLKEGTTNKFKYPIKNNVLAQIDVFLDNGYTKEEMKMVNETRKILGDDSLRITCTAVRVPVENSHAISINVELEKEFEVEDLIETLRAGKNIIIEDDIKNEVYPIPERASGTDEVYIGRIRRDESIDNGVNIWVVADNIRKGAATNAVENAELLLEED
ncbi:MAG: aspartate-semialdehyde dehydrogenase [Finegoldia sp.]|nr:aspartate-semialdehyde dehydrogenase [Finegoldia sp.]